MNRRLFWKIFLPFWVAQALLLGVLYMRLHIGRMPKIPGGCSRRSRLVPTLADLAARRYEEAGQPALRALLDQSVLPHRANYWLLDANRPRAERASFAGEILDYRPARLAT